MVIPVVRHDVLKLISLSVLYYLCMPSVTRYFSSGVRHLTELEEAGLPYPAVNQIEVCIRQVSTLSGPPIFLKSAVFARMYWSYPWNYVADLHHRFIFSFPS